MKIVEIIPAFFPLGGAERLVFDLTKAMALSGEHEVTVVSLYAARPDEVKKVLANLPTLSVVFLDKKRGVDFSCAKRLCALLDEIGPDVIHCHLDSLVTLYLARRMKKYPTFYTFHTIISGRTVGSKIKPKNLLYRRLFKRNYVRPLAIAKAVQEAVCAYYRLAPQNVPIVKNGVPLTKYQNDRAYLKRVYDFIFIGRFIEIKNPDIIVCAMQRLLKEHPRTKLIMLGEGALLDKCKALAGDQLGRAIKLPGFVDDVSPYLANAKTLLLPSSYEGNPMVINEAIASGCFILANNVGGIPDLVNKSNGLLMDPKGDLVTAVYESMAWCLEHENLIETQLKASGETNRSEVSIDSCAKGYLHIFQENLK